MAGAVAVVVVVAALAAASVRTLGYGSGDAPPAATGGPAQATSGQAPGASPPAGGWSSPSSPATSPTNGPAAEAAALGTLRQLRDQDRVTVTFQGQYVAWLAAKHPGIVDPYQTTADGSHTFQAVDVLAEHLALRGGDNLGARVILLLSTDFGRRALHDGQPLWTTAAVGDFGSRDTVTAWCARRFPTQTGDALKNQCFAGTLEPPDA